MFPLTHELSYLLLSNYYQNTHSFSVVLKTNSSISVGSAVPCQLKGVLSTVNIVTDFSYDGHDIVPILNI
jgi:hypothetical protein